MTAQRSRKQAIAYKKFSRRNNSDCNFCVITASDAQLVSQSQHFKIVRNIFPYSIWDGQSVKDHLMLIPQSHTETLADLSPEASLEFVKLISSFESKGYCVWTRPPSSTVKSVLHQHTHLIKLDNRMIKAVFFVTKPHLRLVVG